MRALPYIICSLILMLVVLLIIVGVQDLPEQSRILNLQPMVLLSILASVAASSAFFTIVEVFRALTERASAKEAARLERFEKELGIKDVFSSKSQREIIKIYKEAVSNAQSRIWAVGLSNNQFLEQHQTTIKLRRHAYPALDVRVHFFNPDAEVNEKGLGFTDYPLINLFDFPKSIYKSDKRKNDAREFAKDILSDKGISARVFYILLPCYFSLMIVDETAFFFPYLAAPEDASSNPMMMVSTSGEIGTRLVQHVEQLAANTLLCREQTASTLA